MKHALVFLLLGSFTTDCAESQSACAQHVGFENMGGLQTLSQEQLRRSVLNTAGFFRLRRLDTKLKAGKAVRIAVIGGSVEYGFMCPYGSTLWHTYVRNWLASQFQVEVQLNVYQLQSLDIHMDSASTYFPEETYATGLMNGTSPMACQSFTPPNTTRMLHPAECPAQNKGDYDLVLVQSSVNFPLFYAPPNGALFVKERFVVSKYQELALRELLGAPSPPAVILVNWMLGHLDYGSIGAVRKWASVNGIAHDFSTWEDNGLPFLSMYYEVPMVSARSALFHSVLGKSASDIPVGPTFAMNEFFGNIGEILHPSPLGQALFGQLVTSFLCNQLALLASHPSPTHPSASILPEAIFTDPGHLVALRRSTDYSGFESPSESIAPMLSSDSAGWANASTRNASEGSWSPLALEIRGAGLPLVFVEIIYVFCQLCSDDDNVIDDASGSSHPARFHTLSLELLRFVGVAHIVVFHEGMLRPNAIWGRFAACGKYWVQYFFALSGFVLYTSQNGARSIQDPLAFVRRRVIRAYPGYFFGAVLAMAAAKSPLHSLGQYLMGELIPGLLLMDSWLYPYGTAAPNGPGWFLCTLLVFWICFPHWYRMVNSTNAPVVWAVWIWLASFGIPVLHALLEAHAGGFSYDFAEFHPLANWQPFLFGMLLAKTLQELEVKTVPQLLRKGAASAALVTLALITLVCPTQKTWTLFLDKGPLLLPMLGVLLIFVSIGEDVILRPEFLESRTAQWLGAMSGQLFILHWAVRLCIARFWISIPVWVVFLIQFITAALFHELQERVMGRTRLAHKRPSEVELVSSASDSSES